jgi:hypothetical protein
MHVLTVIAKDLSPEHLLAAIKHWAAKFEQEILNKDRGPSASGRYEFEHDGKPTEVHWHPNYHSDHRETDPAEMEKYRRELEAEEAAEAARKAAADEDPAKPVPGALEFLGKSLGVKDEGGPIDPAVASPTGTAAAGPTNVEDAPAPSPTIAATSSAPLAPPPEALAALKVVEQQEGQGSASDGAGDQPKESRVEGESAADAAVRVAPDLA